MFLALFAVCLFGLGCIRAFVCFAIDIVGRFMFIRFFLFGRERLPVVGPQTKIPCLLKFVRAIIMRI